MARNRSEQVNLDVTLYYHCVSTCVRRAFLCGLDRYSGKNYEHRRAWVRARIRYLCSLFAIEVVAYAILSNHLHLIQRVDVAAARAWSEQEVVSRYTELFRSAHAQYLQCADDERRRELVEAWRERLCSVSWFMRALNEHIARRANAEDGCRGRFWEGRFKSQPILDDQGLLACMAYVDLNPVRAGMADTLEGSDFTSIQERLNAVAENGASHAPERLVPFSGQELEREGAMPIQIGFEEYVELLLWSGSRIAAGKRGRLSAERAPRVLKVFGIDPKGWLNAFEEKRISTATFLGTVPSLEAYAQSRNMEYVRGIGTARLLAA